MRLLPQLPTRPTLFCVSLHQLARQNRRLLWVAVIVVGLTALGAGSFAHAYLGILHRAFRDRSLAYVQAFASASLSWVAQGDVAMLRSAGQLLLVGSARYVQISDGTNMLVDERAAPAETLDLPQRQDIDSSALSRVTTDAGSYLDILAPLPAMGVSAASASAADGYVRVGIDRGAVLTQSRGALLLTCGAALGFDVLLIGLLAIALRRPHQATNKQQGERRIRCGPLQIDYNRKSVTLNGSPLSLTPKQFALLALLAGDPGRTFAEREILDGVWPDSPYADAKDIKQYVYLLRKRFAAVDPRARELIETAPGFGYRLACENIDLELT